MARVLRRRVRRSALPLRFVAVALVLLACRSARADELETLSWRRGGRPPESPQRFALELRFGPYHPNVDEQFPVRQPYAASLGADSKPLYVGVEFDWQFLRLAQFASLGAGFGWGYTTASGTATVVGTGAPSAAETRLTIMPMYGVGVLRFDYLARETVIPFVGYAKAGLGYGLWRTSNDVETQGKGHTWGMHYALGGMLLLDAFDEHSAVELDNEWGVNNTYFYVEWMFANLNGLDRSNDLSVMHIGTSTWVMGLAIEM